MTGSKSDINDLLTGPGGWRRVRRDGHLVVQKRASDQLYGSYESFTLDELTDKVRASGMEEYRIEVETEQGTYGDSDYGVLNVVGWRAATETEIKLGLDEIDQGRKRAREWEDRQIANLKRTRPELFR